MLVYDVEINIIEQALINCALQTEEPTMGDEWDQNPTPEQPNFDDLDKRIDEIRRKVIESTSEAQLRIKRVVDKAGEYWQQTNAPLEPHRASSVEKSAFAILLICGV